MFPDERRTTPQRTDCVAVDEVSCEPYFAKFPVYQGKYREILRFSDAVPDRFHVIPSVYAGFH